MKATQWSFRRVEKKYLLNMEQYERLRVALRDYIVPDDYPKSTICNVYYDTPDYLLISRSLEKPVYKEKFRLRSTKRSSGCAVTAFPRRPERSSSRSRRSTTASSISGG